MFVAREVAPNEAALQATRKRATLALCGPDVCAPRCLHVTLVRRRTSPCLADRTAMPTPLFSAWAISPPRVRHVVVSDDVTGSYLLLSAHGSAAVVAPLLAEVTSRLEACLDAVWALDAPTERRAPLTTCLGECHQFLAAQGAPHCFVDVCGAVVQDDIATVFRGGAARVVWLREQQALPVFPAPPRRSSLGVVQPMGSARMHVENVVVQPADRLAFFSATVEAVPDRDAVELLAGYAPATAVDELLARSKHESACGVVVCGLRGPDVTDPSRPSSGSIRVRARKGLIKSG